ncbi:uncharacterized protein MELLADRAFT_89773 [Melampsora larici-populina 98AG31]|uniref:Uncharacterized protein n=1 Tax=Melampsora larici-populina (strain 98AG31 / pathotype 3-4-7) TaxID=747676 RepID=F4RUK4_MELLP|nr:uncharacterized protein MELLADRAFT_89773 [Melampsora larici-populina 98AG31]EGG03979.1 hypothetical protein MELLADRAFT_89773 [Melampsora larici-populina 98AG31]
MRPTRYDFFFKLSISSTESAVESTAQAITAAKPSVHAQAVSMTYLSTPAEVCDEWLLSVITD